jgi:hypothetical protein
MPCIAALGSFVGFSAVAWGFTWTANTIVGEATSADYLVTAWVERSGRQGCSSVDVRPELTFASPRTLCFSAAIAPGTWIRFSGSGTVLGQNVEKASLSQ